MQKKPVLLLLLLLSFHAGFCQNDLWNTIIKQEDNQYIINMPEGWKRVDIAGTSGKDYKFDFSGVGIPATTAEGAPVAANFTIERMAGHNYSAALEKVAGEFTVFYDRVTEPGYSMDSTSATIKSGETGTVVHSRYYRRSKVSNYSHYYLIVDSKKNNEMYILALHFQYKDPMYSIERSGHFSDYAMQVFRHFEIR